MPVTLSDDQVASLRAELEQGRRDKVIRESVEQIWNSPKLGDRAKDLWKEQFPDSQIEGHDLKKEIFGRLDREKEEREKAAAEAAERERLEHFQRQKSEVQARHSLTDDAMDRMEKEMNERKVYDYEVMAEHFVARQPKPIENTQRSHMWNYDQAKEFKEISADPEKYAFNELVKAINNDEARLRNR